MAKKKPTQKVEEILSDEKIYFVLDKTSSEYEIEYVIKTYDTEKGTLVQMFIADNGSWSPSVAGDMVASVTDTGDGYEWKVCPVSKEHDHSDAYVMMIMMNFLDSLNSIRSKYEIVATSKLIDVKHN
jgi:hypothetical protein